jgi:allantoin racemase
MIVTNLAVVRFMRIQIINPNASASMTQIIGRCARTVAHADTEIIASHPAMGPVSIESHYDEALSVPGLLTEIARGETEGVDAYVIACFGDPGLFAARELARGPVIGIAEAAMHTASFLGRSFSVVTTLSRTAGRAWDLAEQYGMQRFCRKVRACEVAVLELETDPDAYSAIVKECRLALEEDGADCIVLGCAGMADLCASISTEIQAPVIDGVTAATLLAESLVRMGLSPRKKGEFAHPRAKQYIGLLEGFSLR